MSARRSLSWSPLVDNIAKRAGNEFRERKGASCRRERGRDSEVRSDSSSGTDKGNVVGSVPSRQSHSKITSERESEKSLASEFQQIRKFLAQRAGAGSEADTCESATGVLNFLTSVLPTVFSESPQQWKVEDHSGMR